MANIFVRSGGDAGAWTGTVASVATGAATDAAGDVFYVASDHAESNSTTQSWAFAGTAASPTKVICGTTAASPPTTSATTGVCTTTSSGGFTLSGWYYIYGLTFNVGSGAVNTDFICGSDSNEVTFESCTINLVATGTTGAIDIGVAGNVQAPRVNWRNVTISTGAAAQGIDARIGNLYWDGGGIAAMGHDMTSGLIRPSSAGENIRIQVSACDLSEVGVTGFLVAKASNSRADVRFIDCKIPAFTTGGVYTGTLQAGDRISVYNCHDGDLNYRLAIYDYFGIILHSASVYNDAGASDGTTRISWEMASSIDCEFPHQCLVSDEIVKWNETTTGTLTATVEIVHNSQGSGTGGALKDNEIWLEVMCMDPGGSPVGKWQSDRVANLNLNAEAADQASSSAAWTGDAAGWDTQKLVVSFTPKEKGFVHARVCLAKASATVYVDPLLTIA